MRNLDTITGTYGSGQTSCDIFIYDNGDGTAWYCVEGSANVNKYFISELIEGIDVETLNDIDTFSWSEPIESEDMLEHAVEN